MLKQPKLKFLFYKKKQDWAFGQISLRERRLPILIQILAAGFEGPLFSATIYLAVAPKDPLYLVAGAWP